MSYLFKASAIIAILIIAVSCDTNRVYENNVDFPNESWHKDSLVTFEVDITDSLAIYNMYINCRINGQYGKYDYSNLYLFVDTYLPYNHEVIDTLECILADPDGRWLGKGFGNIWSNKIPYRMNFKFPYSGHYTFTLEQAMREETLKHVTSAGIRIEKAR